MASKPRNFKANIPISVAARWAFRLDLFRHEEALVTRFVQLLAKWSVACNVAILAYEVRATHVHVEAVQFFDGHRSGEGVAAMMQNVMSALAISANITYSHEGRIVERPYRSHNVRTYGGLLRQMAYMTHQDLHHGAGALASSRGVVTSAEATDGVVTHIVRFPGLMGDGADEEDDERYFRTFGEVMEEIAAKAVRYERMKAKDEDPGQENLHPADRVKAVNPWGQATREVCEARGLPMKAKVEQVRLVPVQECRDAAAHEAQRAELLSWEYPIYVFQPREATKVGSVFEMRVVRLEIVETRDKDGKVVSRVERRRPDP